MFAHLVDHFFLSNRRLAENTKWVVFGITAVAIIGNFWWFKGLAFGVEGPIKDHTGLLWRKVSDFYRHITDNIFTVSPRLGTYTTMCTSNSSVFRLRYFAHPRASSTCHRPTKLHIHTLVDYTYIFASHSLYQT